MAIDVEAYYRQYGPMVYRRCRYLLKHDEEARDAMQDVFVKLIQHEHSLRDDNPSSLLLRISTNECLNRIRSRKRKPEDRDETLLDRIANAKDEGEQSLAKNLLNLAFGKQPESTRTIAVLHYLDGFTLEETAKQVGMSVSGVRKRLRNLSAQVKDLAEVQG